MTSAVLWWKQVSDRARKLTNKEINRAGLLIRESDTRTKQLDEAFDTVGIWRSFHSYALREAYEVLEQRAKTLDATSVVSLRLKRIPAIRTKLCRPENHNMKLSKMQDIAGCRAVVGNLADVQRLAAQYGTPTRDYVAHPKPDGYRSIHIVEHHYGCQVEHQIRTGFQHAWAAAVETVDLLLGQKLKTGGGDAKWKHFFKLASSALAMNENSPLVRDTPTDRKELAKELRQASDDIGALHLLKGIHLVPYTAKNALTKAAGAAYLITLDMRNNSRLQTHVRVYQERELEKANQDYVNLEKDFSGDRTRQALLLSVEQVSHIEPAYPAYFMQAHTFIWMLEEFTNAKNLGI